MGIIFSEENRDLINSLNLWSKALFEQIAEDPEPNKFTFDDFDKIDEILEENAD